MKKMITMLIAGWFFVSGVNAMAQCLSPNEIVATSQGRRLIIVWNDHNELSLGYQVVVKNSDEEIVSDIGTEDDVLNYVVSGIIPGVYSISVKTICPDNIKSEWSRPIELKIRPTTPRGLTFN